MSLLKIASVACIALTLGACQSLFQPSYRTPLEGVRDATEQSKPGCASADCPLVNIDTVHFAKEPKLDALIEQRLLEMTRTNASDPLPSSLEAYREQFLQTAAPHNSMYLQAKVREQHDGLVIIELSSYLDQGATHGEPGRGFINYSRQQQKALTLTDMLLPGKEDAFWKAAQVSHNSWQISTRLSLEPEFVKSYPFQKTPNVALTSSAVTLKYPTATIAPYALGHVELQIPYSRLEGILRPELVPARH
ncbi:RsiV family protein [Pseudomonas khavaziana]|uniref:RsiV family protein n=1 Tax=Pseudomonas khavaziana TaxID=2842351 RepID=UPI001C3CA76B|nr:RsiV family protein [Pseudomonas khavaziana]MBV4480251.1 RsiV family protein [Pseudomonas khavaziana]